MSPTVLGKLIRDGENGFSCQPSMQAFVGRIDQYVQNPELLEVHAGINRPMMKPMSLDGTAEFFHGVIDARLMGERTEGAIVGGVNG